MPSRVIKANVTGGYNADKANGAFIWFETITSDTGPVANGVATSASLYLSSIKTYGAAAFNLLYGGSNGAKVAKTGALASNSNTHAATVALSDLAAALLSSSTDRLTLQVVYSNSNNVVNVREGCTLTLTIEYEISTTPTGAPSSVSVAGNNVAPGAEVVLSWSGASAGTNNAITGYEIHRATAAAGPFDLLHTIESTATSGAATVTAPEAAGETYFFKVRTLGAEAGFDSDLSAASAALACTLSAPTAPTLSAPEHVRAGDPVVLTWSGAVNGVNNPITGFMLLRNGEIFDDTIGPEVSSYVLPTESTDAGGVVILSMFTLGTYTDSAESATVVVRIYSDPAAPVSLSVTDPTPKAGERVKLSWGTAEPGGHNAVKCYNVYRSTSETDGFKLLSTTTATSCYVSAPAKAGAAYYFRVEAVGALSSSGMSSAFAVLTASEAGDSSDADITVEVRPQTRARRRLIIGSYDTARDGLWTLSGWSCPEPDPKSSLLDVPGKDGPLDLSDVLTDGDPRFNGRTLTATLETSEGTREERLARIEAMVNALHGRVFDVILPDDTARYITGRVRVRTEYNDMSHACVTVTATCDPWRCNLTETVIMLTAAAEAKVQPLPNTGRRLLVPSVEITAGKVQLFFGAYAWTLAPGVYELPELLLQPGNNLLTYSGSGRIFIRYREAVL